MKQDAGEGGQQPLWFVRRNGARKGPFPSGTLRRFVLMGRLRMEDQVSRDGKQWLPVAEVPEVLSPQVREALASGTLDELLQDRLREDERDGRERRKHEASEAQLRRRQGERRDEEDELVQRHRESKTRLRELAGRRSTPWLASSIVGVIVLGMVAYGLLLGRPDEIADPQCSASPAPGVSWRNCRLPKASLAGAELQKANLDSAILPGSSLSGANLRQANLQYADLSASDLSYADLGEARLKGADLRNSDLTNADLRQADLAFANLQGSRLGGAQLEHARLGNAIWVDGSRCAESSLSVCLPQESPKESVR